MKTLYIATSLDGYIAGSDGNVDWLPSDPDNDYGYGEFLESVEVLIMGNNTYRQVLGFGKWPYKGKKVYVVSRSGGEDKNVEFTKDPVALAESLIGNVWVVGGSQINSILLPYIDRIILTIVPVVLGDGIPLFRNAILRKMKLVDSKIYGNGFVQLTYE